MNQQHPKEMLPPKFNFVNQGVSVGAAYRSKGKANSQRRQLSGYVTEEIPRERWGFITATTFPPTPTPTMTEHPWDSSVVLQEVVTAAGRPTGLEDSVPEYPFNVCFSQQPPRAKPAPHLLLYKWLYSFK